MPYLENFMTKVISFVIQVVLYKEYRNFWNMTASVSVATSLIFGLRLIHHFMPLMIEIEITTVLS